jgi:hypothetical protein
LINEGLKLASGINGIGSGDIVACLKKVKQEAY